MYGFIWMYFLEDQVMHVLCIHEWLMNWRLCPVFFQCCLKTVWKDGNVSSTCTYCIFNIYCILTSNTFLYCGLGFMVVSGSCSVFILCFLVPDVCSLFVYFVMCFFSFFFQIYFWAFYAFNCTGQWSDDRKRGGEVVGRGPGNDIRPDLNLCPRGQ